LGQAKPKSRRSSEATVFMNLMNCQAKCADAVAGKREQRPHTLYPCFHLNSGQTELIGGPNLRKVRFSRLG
jgi:hypothetical protein